MLHTLAGMALALRLAVAWWSVRVGQPDQVFQYLEQAHRLVYGYGFIPWEYRFGIRSWLLPGALAGMLVALRAIGLDQPTAYIPVLKSVFAALSVSLVYASYAIGRHLFSEGTGRIVAVLATIWYELLYFSTIPTPEVVGAYAILVAFALGTGRAICWRPILVGLLLGSSVALRLQYAVPACAVCLYAVNGRDWRYTLSLSVSGAAIIAFAGMVDAWTWGVPFASYYNNFAFNALYGVSKMWGQQPFLWYVYILTIGSAGLHVVAICYGLLAWKRCWPILILIACVLVPHSDITHKDYRFIFCAIPLLLLLLADAIARALPLMHLVFKRCAFPATICIIAAISVVGCAFRRVFKQDDRLLAFTQKKLDSSA